jgi:DNA repair protein RadD
MLREYQASLLDQVLTSWKTCNNVLLQAPTGSGKSEIACELIQSLPKDKIVRVIVHRKELVEQFSEFLYFHNIQHSFIASGYKQEESNVYVTMAQTLVRRPTMHVDLDIIDECHHASSKTYEHIFSNNHKILGLTATPRRLDGKPLKMFDSLILGPTIQDLIQSGYLAIPEVYVPPESAAIVNEIRDQVPTLMGDYQKNILESKLLSNDRIYGDVLDHYYKLNPNKSLIFCTSVRHVYETEQLFNDNNIPAKGIDGTLSREERKQILQEFKDGSIKVLISCDLIGEGLNVPDADCAILLRPTKSLTLYLQQIGRAMRVTDTKRTCKIVDHVNNVAYFGPPWIKRYWTLDGYNKKTRTDSISGVNLKLCLKCGNYINSNVLVCPHCGNIFKSKSKIWKTIETELQKITIESAQKLIEQTVQKIINRERYKMEVRDEAYYAQKFVEWKVTGESVADFTTRKLKEDAEKKEIWKNGTRDQLIDMYAKNKKIASPSAKADEVLAKRAEFLSRRTENPVYANGTLEDIIADLKKNKPQINNPEAYAQGILRKRLAPAFAQGTENQKKEATVLVNGVDTGVKAPATVTLPNSNTQDQYDELFAYAKSGKAKKSKNVNGKWVKDSEPSVFTDEEAHSYAQAIVKYKNKAVLESGSKEEIAVVARLMRVRSVDAWVDAVLAKQGQS